MTELRIGPTSRAWLATVGIWSLEDLQDLGALAAWRKVEAAFPGRVNVDLLYALQAMLEGCTAHDLAPEVREDLRRQVGA